MKMNGEHKVLHDKLVTIDKSITDLRKYNKQSHLKIFNRLGKGNVEFAKLKVWNYAMRYGMVILYVALGYIIFGN